MTPPFITLAYPLSVNRYWTIDASSRSIRPTAAGRAWKTAARALAHAQGARHHLVAENPVAVDLVLLPRTNKDGSASAHRLDLDNCLKVTLDAMQTVLFSNDRQVIEINAKVGSPVAGGALLVRARPA
mgnify:CR=1 FL=1